MPTKMQSFRLTAATASRLARLVAGSATRQSQAEIIADALFAYERAQVSPAQRALLDVYDLVGDSIQPLQYIQDERDLTPDEEEVLDFLNRIWDEARTLKFFTEPSLPQEPWEKTE